MSEEKAWVFGIEGISGAEFTVYAPTEEEALKKYRAWIEEKIVQKE